MLPFIKRGTYIALAIGCMSGLWSCSHNHKKSGYSYNAAGYYYQLLAFSSGRQAYARHAVAHLAIGFYTQADSLFWDSGSNLNDNFFIAVDSLAPGNFIKQYVSHCTSGDSACLLIRTADFYRQQFKTTQVPFFSRGDSVVKIRFRLRQVLGAAAFASANISLQLKEEQQIRAAFASAADFEKAKDTLGFYWVKRPLPSQAPFIQPGSQVTLFYRGAYLNGRFLEASAQKFELVYGMPDQLLKGLNYVIGKIKLGQNAKIILPSRLAFGENGSTNGLVPPYTPLLYEIKITDVKK